MNWKRFKRLRNHGNPLPGHSGARAARTSDVQLHIGESRGSGFTLRVPRNDA
jgi:hypothetical protein